MRRFRMVDMCKGKKKLWLRGTDDVLIVGLHMVGKRVNVSSLNKVTSFLACLFFLSLDSSLSYLSYHSYFLILFFFFHSFIVIFFFFFTFLLFVFFPFHTHTFLFIFPSLDIFSKLSTLLFLASIQSEILNKPCWRWDETLKVGCVQGMRCTKEMYRFGYGIRRCTGLPMWKTRYRIHDEASNKR
jgi:hypothetical protein